MIERRVQFAGCAGAIAGLGESDAKVEVIVGDRWDRSRIARSK